LIYIYKTAVNNTSLHQEVAKGLILTNI